MSGDEKKPFHNPFAGLAGLRDGLPQGRTQEEKEKDKLPARAVVRLERKGRGGKEVTVIEHLELPKSQLPVWLDALKTGLGCGGVLEDGALVLQGDQRERAKKLLEKRGVKKVTVGT